MLIWSFDRYLFVLGTVLGTRICEWECLVPTLRISPSNPLSKTEDASGHPGPGPGADAQPSRKLSYSG